MRPEDKIWLNSQIKNMVNKKYTQEMTPAERVKGGASALPVIGDAISGYDAYQSAKQGDYLGAALNAVGLLPIIPGLAGITKPISRIDGVGAVVRNTIPVSAGESGFMRQDVHPVTEWLENLLKNNKIPHETTYSGSSYGPSTYTKIHGLKDDTRISNHSKGVFNNQFYNQPISPDDFIDTLHAAIKANPKRSAAEIEDILKKQKVEEIINLYPIRLKSADKKIAKGKSLTKSEIEAIDWRNSGGIMP